MSDRGGFGDGSDCGDPSGAQPASSPHPPAAPRSRREALAREAAAGSGSRAAVRAVPRSRSPLPVSGEVSLSSRSARRRGHPVAGPLQVSAPMQRLRAMLADLPESTRPDGTGEQPTAGEDTGTGGATGSWTGWVDRARRVAQHLRMRFDRLRPSGPGQLDPGNGGSGPGGVLRRWSVGTPAEDGVSATDRRRQLVTLALALGGLGLTGWAAARVTTGVGVTSANDAAVPDRAGDWPNSPSPRATPSPAGTGDLSIVLGYGEIDRQHQRAADLLGLLDEAFRTGDRRWQGVVLTDLVAWVRVHFAFEEALMDSYQLPGMAEHTAHHQAFLAQTSTFAARFEAGTVSLTPRVIGMLRSWMHQHVTSDDVALVAALNVRGVPSVV